MTPADCRRFKALRKHARLSQTALARRAGLSQAAISQIEAGERDPSFSTCVAIAKALGVTHAYLLGTTVQRTPDDLYCGLSPAMRRELAEFADYLRAKKAKREHSKP